MNYSSMSPQELRKLADKKEQENVVRKVGYLKCDLYNFQSDRNGSINFSASWGSFWLKTKEEKDDLIREFKSRFEKVLKKGTKFVCFITDGEECWFDDENYGVESMTTAWAAEWLENQTDVEGVE